MINIGDILRNDQRFWKSQLIGQCKWQLCSLQYFVCRPLLLLFCSR